MFSKIKQVQELRSQANQIKKAWAEESVEGAGGWGKVKITMDGNQEVTKVEIAQDILGDKSKLESGIAEATNDAIKKVQRVMAQKMSSLGMKFPGMN